MEEWVPVIGVTVSIVFVYSILKHKAEEMDKKIQGDFKDFLKRNGLSCDHLMNIRGGRVVIDRKHGGMFIWRYDDSITSIDFEQMKNILLNEESFTDSRGRTSYDLELEIETNIFSMPTLKISQERKSDIKNLYEKLRVARHNHKNRNEGARVKSNIKASIRNEKKKRMAERQLLELIKPKESKEIESNQKKEVENKDKPHKLEHKEASTKIPEAATPEKEKVPAEEPKTESQKPAKPKPKTRNQIKREAKERESREHTSHYRESWNPDQQ